ncbi:hypothetical protein NCC49_006019 [Naganishia albida]|nr:hypothetical protein NCC49_006019 [Naganishia albida]
MGSKSKNFYSKWAKKNRQREQLGLPPLPRPEFPRQKRKRSRKPAKDGAAKARVPAASAASGPVKSTPESIEQPQDYEFTTDGVSYASLDEMGVAEDEEREDAEMKADQVREEEGDDVQEGMDGEGRADKEREDAEVAEPGSPVGFTNERAATPDAQVAPADDIGMPD